MVVDLDRNLAAVALRQHSVVTLDDVERAGGDKFDVHLRVSAGRWILVHDRVYRLAGAPWTFEGRVFAAVCAAGDGAVVSHFCAARLHGFGFPTALVELAIKRGRFHRPKGATVHTSTDLDRCGVVLVAGCIPATDVARTLLDLAGSRLGDKLFVKVVTDARRMDLVDWHDLVVTLAKHARRGRRGIRRLRETIAAGTVDEGLTETDSELVAVALLAEGGFPTPTLQHVIRAVDGRVVARMDIAFVFQRANFEIDGPVHDDPAVAAKDDERDHELRTRYDWIVRRIPHRIPLDEPRRFLAIVRETLSLRPDSKL
ncbi:MAG TPA: hypothetical protein VMZ22_06650 [Acidimicrobiales bacterium]|nr:hypothetical protein [Acidimicrobiales bacterium]